MIDMGEEEIWKKNSCVDSRGMLSASCVKSVFSSLVEGAIKECAIKGYLFHFLFFPVFCIEVQGIYEWDFRTHDMYITLGHTTTL